MIGYQPQQRTAYPLPVASLPFVDLFPNVASPMPDGSVYRQGGTDGGSWTDMQTDASHLAYANTRESGFNDAIAIVKQLSGISTVKHYAQITKHLAGGYTPADSHEIEALVFFDITSGNARGYEADDVGNNVIPVRWNGALNDFAEFGTGWGTTISGSEVIALGDGDVFKVFAQILAGNVRITYNVNGSDVFVFEDQSAGKITSGYPGMGSFIRTGVALADMSKISISRFEAGNW